MNSKKIFSNKYGVWGNNRKCEKHWDIKLVTTDKQKNKFALEPNYHSSKYISEGLLVMELKKTEIKMNKSIYICQAILDIS